MAGFFSFFRKKKDEEQQKKAEDLTAVPAENQKAEGAGESIASDPEIDEAAAKVEEQKAELTEEDAKIDSDLKESAADETAEPLAEPAPQAETSKEAESAEVSLDLEETLEDAARAEPLADKGPAVSEAEDFEEFADKAAAEGAEKSVSKLSEKTAGESAKAEESAAETSKEAAESFEESVSVEQEEKLSFFERLKKTRENLAYGISAFVMGREIDDELYEDLETALLTADLGVETTQKVIEKLRIEAKVRELHDAALLKKRLKKILTALLEPCEIPLKPETDDGMPFVILMVGVNGAGKTTTIGKLAQKYLDQGKKVMLAAGDTFRAAAVEQLKEWGERTGVPVVAQATGSDSASVLYDALNSAIAKKADILICDTAGRLQNKDHLMNELKKIVKVLKKIDERVPHEVLLVLDAATGQNAVSQTKLFKEAVGVTGLCLTKLDGSAKGGVVFSLANLYNLPIRFVGIGERATDLREFKAQVFVDALVD